MLLHIDSIVSLTMKSARIASLFTVSSQPPSLSERTITDPTPINTYHHSSTVSTEHASPRLLTQIGSTNSISQEATQRLMPKMTFTSNIRTIFLPASALRVQIAKDIPYETTYKRLSHSSWPVSDSLNYPNTDHTMGLSANREVNFADQAKVSLSFQKISPLRPLQTISLLMVPHKFDKTPPPSKSHSTVSSAEIPAHIRAKVWL